MSTFQNTISIRAWYFDDTLDLKKFRAANPHYPILRQDPLVIELERGRFAVLAKFGTVVFWDYDDAAAKRLRDEIYEFIADRSFDDRLEDQVPVVVGAARDEILSNEVRLVRADEARISIVALTMAQSVALDHLERKLDEVLGRLLVHIEALRVHGRVMARTKEISQTVGFAMSAKHSILSNLTLFDKPEETWESPEVENLYRALYEETFDLNDRVRAVDRKLDFLEENVTLLLDLVQNRILIGLEAAIVALFILDIVIMLIIGN